MSDPIAAPIHTLITIFHEELPDVRFPEVDAAVLGQAADEVRARAEAVARAEAMLLDARAALEAGQDALLGKAQRALSYARIFAEDEPKLSSRLEAITLPRPTARAPREGMPFLTPADSALSAAPRRARARKQQGPAPLFSGSSDAEPLAAAG